MWTLLGTQGNNAYYAAWGTLKYAANGEDLLAMVITKRVTPTAAWITLQVTDCTSGRFVLVGPDKRVLLAGALPHNGSPADAVADYACGLRT